MPAPIQRTLILFKPDAVQRRLCGRLLQRFEDKGLRVVGMKLMKIGADLAAKPPARITGSRRARRRPRRTARAAPAAA